MLNITNKVAADLGAVISPTREVLQKADAQYFENLQNQLRAAYQPENRDKVDQEALQNMFGYMQSRKFSGFRKGHGYRKKRRL